MNYKVAIEELRFRVLAPAAADVPRHFRKTLINHHLHESLVREAQLVRGLALSECGNVGASLSVDGRLVQAADADSWHVLLQNGEGRTLGCARYRPMEHSAEQLGAHHSAIARSRQYGPMLRSALDRLISSARNRNKCYGEAGGWALRREIRGSTAAVSIALMTFALAEHLGAGLAITTATRMHHSSSILCRIGASRLAELPAYYEPKYASVIEILHFDLPNTNPRYAAKLNKLRAQILNTTVVCSRGGSASQPVDDRKIA